MIGKIKQVGNDIMFHAITHGNIHDVIALLHDNECDVNATNINGQTPLHVSHPATHSLPVRSKGREPNHYRGSDAVRSQS